ncbi:MAG: hypothetical protein SGJ27_20970 [Candidatus Melainabacteria bacterium]|nr:hypothetical protein [Candidatus Melainabacteria bacterium]
MQPETEIESKPVQKKVVEARLKPTFPLISNQPERFGALSEAFLFVEEKRLYDLIGKVKIYSVVAGILLAIPIALHVGYRIYTNAPFAGTILDVAKILVVYFLIGSCLVLTGFSLYRHKIMELLAQLEDLAYFGDDMARFYMPYMRTELKDFNEKIRKHNSTPGMPSSMEIFRDLWPVINLLLKRDPDIIKWGRVGMKAYKSISALFKGSHTSSSST